MNARPPMTNPTEPGRVRDGMTAQRAREYAEDYRDVTVRNAFMNAADTIDAQSAEIARLRAERDADQARISRLAELNDRVVSAMTWAEDALRRIERWTGEFPPSGKTWPNGQPMSYSAAFGSNGERDFMRVVARQALARITALDTPDGASGAKGEASR